MGCSRPGALAVACVTLAGVVSGLSLFLPYWSKITIANSSSNSDQLELTFGIWGSCLTIQTRGASASSNSTTTAALSSSSSQQVSQKPMTSFTCASYVDTWAVGLKCTNYFSSITDDVDYYCKRVTSDEGESLCAADSPMELLLVNETSATTNTIESRTTREWLGVLTNACSGYGQTSVAMAFITSVCIGLTFMLLVLGITCGSIESWLAKAGSVAAICTACLQSLLGFCWHLEAKAASAARFGTSYYLNMTSVMLLAIAFVAAKTHLDLGKEAQKQLEVGFMMGIDEKPQEEQQLEREVGASNAAVGPLKEVSTIAV